METTELCVRIFNAKGANSTVRDIDIAHWVPPRDPTGGRPKRIICKFIGRLLEESYIYSIG